jgi:hypothetical protein
MLVMVENAAAVIYLEEHRGGGLHGGLWTSRRCAKRRGVVERREAGRGADRLLVGLGALLRFGDLRVLISRAPSAGV